MVRGCNNKDIRPVLGEKPKQTYVGLPVDGEAASHLEELSESVNHWRDWQPTRPDNYHITLRYTNKIESNQSLFQLDGRLKCIADRAQPFQLEFDCPGHLIWQEKMIAVVKLKGDLGRLHYLQDQVDQAMLAVGLGGSDFDKFRPHITVGSLLTDNISDACADWEQQTIAPTRIEFDSIFRKDSNQVQHFKMSGPTNRQSFEINIQTNYPIFLVLFVIIRRIFYS